jgi:membrane protease YdiL (CAAX protease family)
VTAPAGQPVSRARAGVTLIVAIVAFAAALALRERFDPWRLTASAAAVSIALSAWTLGPRLPGLFAIPGRGVVAAIALGLVLVVATHAGFAVIRSWSPDFAAMVRGLYLQVDLGASRAMLAMLTILIVIGEELVWRGVAVAIVDTRTRLAIGATSVALYVLPQLPSHVPILIAAAAGLGTILVVQRLVTGRLADAVITHAIWSVSVFVLFPVV